VLVHCGVATAVGGGRDTREDRGLHRPFREWETARNIKTPVDHQHAESEGGDVLSLSEMTTERNGGIGLL
jgi:hypothetical protein